VIKLAVIIWVIWPFWVWFVLTRDEESLTKLALVVVLLCVGLLILV